MSILVIGEALIDLTIDERSAPPRRDSHVGGSPANVALGLGRLGDAVELLTALAEDDGGRRIAAHLASAGVVVRPESWALDATATARARLNADGSADYDFDIRWVLPPDAALGSPSLVHTGSIATYLEPGCETSLALIRAARRRGALVTFDPNVRPGLIDDADAARARILAVAAQCDVLKLSDEDAQWLFPGGDAIERLLAAGPWLVVVTAGSRGSTLAIAEERIAVPAAAADVADTIGAGDSYMAMLVHELARLAGPAAARAHLRSSRALLALGSRCAAAAAITVSRHGANPPTLAEIDDR